MVHRSSFCSSPSFGGPSCKKWSIRSRSLFLVIEEDMAASTRFGDPTRAFRLKTATTWTTTWICDHPDALIIELEWDGFHSSFHLWHSPAMQDELTTMGIKSTLTHNATVDEPSLRFRLWTHLREYWTFIGDATMAAVACARENQAEGGPFSDAKHLPSPAGSGEHKGRPTHSVAAPRATSSTTSWLRLVFSKSDLVCWSTAPGGKGETSSLVHTVWVLPRTLDLFVLIPSKSDEVWCALLQSDGLSLCPRGPLQREAKDVMDHSVRSWNHLPIPGNVLFMFRTRRSAIEGWKLLRETVLCVQDASFTRFNAAFDEPA